MKAITSNMHGPNKSDQYLVDLLRSRPDVACIQEPRNLDVWQARNFGYKTHRGKTFRGNTAILTRSDFRVKGSWERLLSRAGRRNTYVHDRRARFARIVDDHNNVWLIASVHLNPGRNGLAAVRNAAYLLRLSVIVLAAVARGEYIAIFADWNRKRWSRGKDSPHWFVRRCNLALSIYGIDGVAHSKNLKVKKLRSFRPANADHDALEFELTPKSKI